DRVSFARSTVMSSPPGLRCLYNPASIGENVARIIGILPSPIRRRTVVYDGCWDGSRGTGPLRGMRAMRNTVIALVAFTMGAAAVQAQPQPWADKMFKEGTIHDFGTVPRGALLSHSFKMTNIYAVPLNIMTVRSSCGCVTVTPSRPTLQPRESGTID